MATQQASESALFKGVDIVISMGGGGRVPWSRQAKPTPNTAGIPLLTYGVEGVHSFNKHSLGTCDVLEISE